MTLTTQITAQALELGFADVGFAGAAGGARWGENLTHWLDQGCHGQMDWMAAHQDRRASPHGLWPEARSVVVLAWNYASPLTACRDPNHGAVSIYAQGQDYHDIVKAKLKALARWMVQHLGGDVKVFVDTAPVMEKPLAAQTRLGWQGRHTNLVSSKLGNWFFLGEIYTTLDLPADPPHPDRCGICRTCEYKCPTGALTDKSLDARRCISYLTIEHQGPIAEDLAARMGNWIYGCDLCLGACPWNRFAKPQTQALPPRLELLAPSLADLAQLDDAAFRQVFAGSPIKRSGRNRLVRNVAIAMGNSGNHAFRPVLQSLMPDPDSGIQAAAHWAFRHLDNKG